MKIGILTGGGDCPGLNAVIRSVVKACAQKKHEVYGVMESFNGFRYKEPKVKRLQEEDVRHILYRGGTILQTTNTGNPFKDDSESSDEGAKARQEIKQAYDSIGLDALIVVGGDGTQTMAYNLIETGMNIVGIPKTIDNDLMASELTVGFQTAVNTASEAVERLHSTAEAHRRIMVVEVMGRDSGYIALHAGIAGGASVILLPEVPFSYEPIVKKINQRMEQGRFFCLIVVAEGCVEKNTTEQSFKKSAEGNLLLGGIGQELANKLHQKTGLSARYTVLGHVQRGGSPTASDCILATQFGVKALELVEAGRFGEVVTIKDGRLNSVDYKTIANKRRPVSMDNDLIKTAEGIGINLGR